MSELPPVESQANLLPQNVVIIGGGTGSSTVVRSFTDNPLTGEGVTAIATTFDDGGGTGELRKVYAELPAVGDIRQCLAAMSGLSPRALRGMAHRFDAGELSDSLNLKNQTVGNLNLAGYIKDALKHGETFTTALETLGELFQAKGRVVPPSDDIRTLVFDLPDGTRIYGEHNAEEAEIPSFKGADISFLKGRREGYESERAARAAIEPAAISEQADAAIRDADLVVLAPGDLYTSVGPNLAVSGMKQALKAAKTVMMISNLMNRKYQTSGFKTADYVQELERIIGVKAGEAHLIHRVIYNNQRLDPEALKEQAKDGSHPVRPDVKGLKAAGYMVRGFDLLSRERVAIDPLDELGPSRSQIRHDPARVLAAIFNVYLRNGFVAQAEQDQT